MYNELASFLTQDIIDIVKGIMSGYRREVLGISMRKNSLYS